jgi:hypothetical protein
MVGVPMVTPEDKPTEVAAPVVSPWPAAPMLFSAKNAPAPPAASSPIQINFLCDLWGLSAPTSVIDFELF